MNENCINKIWLNWNLISLIIYFIDILSHPSAQNAPYPQHRQNSHWGLCPFPTSGGLQTIFTVYPMALVFHSICISYHWCLISFVLYFIRTPKMHLTCTTNTILIEFCVLNQRPVGSRHFLWCIQWHWCRIQFVFHIIGIVFHRYFISSERPKCFLCTRQTKFSLSFVSVSNVRRQDPDSHYGASNGIRILLNLYFVWSVCYFIGILYHPNAHYIANRILIEFCDFIQCPANFKHCIWCMQWHWYFIQFVFHTIGILLPWYFIWSECPKCALRTPHTKFSSRFVSSSNVRQVPTTFYGGYNVLVFSLICIS